MLWALIDGSYLIASLSELFISALNERESRVYPNRFISQERGKSDHTRGEVLECNPCDQIHCVRPSDRCIDRIGLAAVQLAVNEVLV